ncbi:MAG: UPF0280 family protein [Caldimicrobium sp.]|nr:UPF0280 family protein [Caldimicrobium sp.]MDW8095126.1 UPF0280 family protein [Caldimicrobium sp.]
MAFERRELANSFSLIPTYRAWVQSPLRCFRVVYKQTDLFVLAERDLTLETMDLVRKIRAPLEAYILQNPHFLKSLEPLPEDEEAPMLVRVMLRAGKTAGVGPMASVAGAIAEAVGRALLEQGLTREVAVENGGDIFLALRREARVALFAGNSPFSGRLALVIPAELQPCGVCTSSGKVGHSLSFGRADAVTVVHRDTAIADALATSFGNLLKGPEDFKVLSSRVKKVEGLYGVLAVLEGKLFVYSERIKLLPLN